MSYLPDDLLSIVLSYGKVPEDVLSGFSEDVVRKAMKAASLKEIESLSCYYILYGEQGESYDYIKWVHSIHSSLLEAKKAMILSKSPERFFIAPFEMNRLVKDDIKYVYKKGSLVRMSDRKDDDKFVDPYDLEKDTDGCLCYLYIYIFDSSETEVKEIKVPIKFRCFQHRVNFIQEKLFLHSLVESFLISKDSSLKGKETGITAYTFEYPSGSFPEDFLDLTDVIPVKRKVEEPRNQEE